jgi:maltose O-acetyltransferase
MVFFEGSPVLDAEVAERAAMSPIRPVPDRPRAQGRVAGVPRRLSRELRGALWALRHGVTCAAPPRLEPNNFHPRVENRGGRIELGRGVWFRGQRMPAAIGVGPSGLLEVGDDVGLNQGSNVFAAKHVSIGSNSLIADLVSIFDTNFHEIEEGEPVQSAPVFIGENVWIGAHSIVLPGVTIGRDTVVGAGSVVVDSLPPGVLAAGNPARARRTIRVRPGWTRR